jgi:ABC-type uncharacterized transport system permease subunit
MADTHRKTERFLRQGRDLFFAVAVVAAFTTVILILAGAPPLAAFYHIFKGSLGSSVKLGHVIKAWIPLTLASCGLLYTFRIGLWNIGVEGQVMMGAVFATWVLRFGMNGHGSPGMLLSAALLAGAAGGAVWALIAGYLKTNGGIHEIFAGLGLNFVAQAVILWLIFGPWKRPGVASMSGTELFPRELWLSYVSALRISPVGMSLAIAALIVTAFMLRYTKTGLSLKAIGSNERAAHMFDLNPPALMLVAMIFAGGFAGLAGSIQVAGIYHRLIPSISSNYGYLALLVVMLANYNVWIAPAVAFFFACLNVGSIQLPMMLQLDSSLSGVIQGALVLSTLAMHAWRQRTVAWEGRERHE